MSAQKKPNGVITRIGEVIDDLCKLIPKLKVFLQELKELCFNLALIVFLIFEHTLFFMYLYKLWK
jgi:hypothetical protein